MNLRLFLSCAVLICVAACSSAERALTPTVFGSDRASKTTVEGLVASGSRFVTGAAVTLYETGASGPGRGALVLGRAVSDSKGRFSVTYGSTHGSGILYLTAAGGNAGHGINAAIELGALAGTRGPANPSITLNERSTVAMAFALAQFSNATGEIIGASSTNDVGIRNAALLESVNLVDPATARPTAFWPSATSCGRTIVPANCEGLMQLNAVADGLAACVQSSGSKSAPCNALFFATGPAHRTTLAAAHAIVLDPSRAVAALLAVIRINHTYVPATQTRPSAWILALKYVGNGKEFDGPGNLVIDANGNLWITNNYIYSSDPRETTCGAHDVLELTPLGNDAPGAPFRGGGLNGAGWGIGFDAIGNVWVSNYGFYGRGCTPKPPANSISEFAADGRALSPPVVGFTQGPIDAPMGTVRDLLGNLWIANNGSGTIVEYRNANHKKSAAYNLGLRRPFGEAVDARDRIWITSSGTDSVAVIDDGGTPIARSPFRRGGLKRPWGIAIDADGDAWITDRGAASVTVLDPSGTPQLGSPISGGGLAVPWGVSVDGNGNAWVSNFTGRDPRVSEICGVRGRCPRGLYPGEPITPAGGYSSALLMRMTAIAIDASGNVWVANNWRQVPLQTNPGGDSMVEFVGLAGPVKQPAVGAVAQP